MLIRRTSRSSPGGKGRRSVEGKLRWIKKNQPAGPTDDWNGFVVYVLWPWVSGRNALPARSLAGIESALIQLGTTAYDGLIPWLWLLWRRGARTEMNLERRLVRDWYVGARPNIMRYDLQAARAEAQRWHVEQEAQLRTSKTLGPAALKDFTSVMRWPDGYWVGLFDIAEDGPTRSLQAVGTLLGHCYQDAGVAREYSDNYSLWTLFDATNRPKWTMATVSSGDRADPEDISGVIEVHGAQNMPVRPEDYPYMVDFLKPSEAHGDPMEGIGEGFDAWGLYQHAVPGSVRVDGRTLFFTGKAGGQLFRVDYTDGTTLGVRCRGDWYYLTRDGWWMTNATPNSRRSDTIDNLMVGWTELPPC